jgi:acylphosphatase
MPIERRRVVYSGRVQGVGFRFTSHRLARNIPVVGFVRNLYDGRVELVAEGECAIVDAFLAAIRSEMGDKIRSEFVTTESIENPTFQDFSIRS